MVAETAGTPLTSVELRRSMNVSSAAVTYLVERMTAADHIRREPDPADRRRAQLRYTAGGLELARAFFTRLGAHMRSEMTELPDEDLMAAHRVFAAMLAAMSAIESEIASSS